MIESKKMMQRDYNATEILKEMRVDNPSAKEALEYILNSSEFIVYKYNTKKPRTFMNRLNMMWVYPLFFITIPIQYLIRGDTGFNRNTKIGMLVNLLVRYD